MEYVDTQRMKRVMDRLHAAPPPPGPPSGLPEECGLLRSEQRLQAALRRVFRTSRRAAGALSGVLRRSEGRSARLRTACFLSGKLPPPERPMPRGEGTVSALRMAWRELESLSEQYAGRKNPRQDRRYEEYSRQCRRDADSVRSILDGMMR